MPVHCPKCQSTSPTGSANCQWCGASLDGAPAAKQGPAGTPCPKCNSRVDAGQPACQFCGEVLVEGYVPPAPTEPTRAHRPERTAASAEVFGDTSAPQGGQPVKTNLPIAIFSTVCCCIPLGIVAIIHAAKANTLNGIGRYHEAQRASDKAQTWAFISIVLGLIVNAFLTYYGLRG